MKISDIHELLLSNNLTLPPATILTELCGYLINCITTTEDDTGYRQQLADCDINSLSSAAVFPDGAMFVVELISLLLKDNGKQCVETCIENQVIKLLSQLLKQSNQYVQHSTIKCIAGYIHICDVADLQLILDTMTLFSHELKSALNLPNVTSNRHTSYVSLFIRVIQLDDKDNAPVIHEVKNCVVSLLCKEPSSLPSNLWLALDRKPHHVFINEYLILLRRIIKYYYSHTDACDVQNLFMSLENWLREIHELDTNPMTFRLFLKLLNKVLPYSKILMSQHEFHGAQIALAKTIVNDSELQEMIYKSVPTYDIPSEVNFGGQHPLPQLMTDCAHVRDHDVRCLRSVLLIILKSCAICLQSDEWKDDQRMHDNIKVTMVKCYTVLVDIFDVESTASVLECDWLWLIAGEHDPTMMEMMLVILDIKKLLRGSLPTQMDIHMLWLNLLDHSGWDHHYLLDLLISPETCFLLFLVRYLHCFINEKDEFLTSADRFHHLTIGPMNSDCQSQQDSSPSCGTACKPTALSTLAQYDSSDSSDTDGVNNVLKQLDGIALDSASDILYIRVCDLLVALKQSITSLRDAGGYPYNPTALLKLLNQVEKVT